MNESTKVTFVWSRRKDLNASPTENHSVVLLLNYTGVPSFLYERRCSVNIFLRRIAASKLLIAKNLFFVLGLRIFFCVPLCSQVKEKIHKFFRHKLLNIMMNFKFKAYFA